MNLGYFGLSMFYFAMICSLVFEGYVILNVNKYAANGWDRLKTSPKEITALDFVYSIFVVVLLFTPYWKHTLLIIVISIFHHYMDQKNKMQYHIFMASSVLCAITLLTILFYQLGH